VLDYHYDYYGGKSSERIRLFEGEFLLYPVVEITKPVREPHGLFVNYYRMIRSKGYG
jgi:hypothetical protein